MKVNMETKEAPSMTSVPGIAANILVDTDEEKEEVATSSSISAKRAISQDTNSSTRRHEMSRKDRLEYRVAKKRKQQAEREMEVASILKSKAWSSNGRTGRHSKHFSQQQRERRMGPISDALLHSMEMKYSARSRVSVAKGRKSNRSKK